MKIKLSISGFVAITSGLIIGLFLQFFIDGQIFTLGVSALATKVLEAMLLVVAVVASTAWTAQYFKQILDKLKSNS